MTIRSLFWLSALSAALLSAAPADGGSAGPAVTGTVVTAAGEPVAGARVTLAPLPGGFERGRAVATGTTGRFHLTASGTGLWTVTVAAPGFVPVRLEPLPLTGPVELPPAVLAESAGARLRVVDTGGNPAAGVQVTAVSRKKTVSGAGEWERAPRSGLTGPDGTLELPRARGERLKATLAAPGRLLTAVEIGKESVVLPASGPIRWLEVRGPEGMPAPGVLVQAGDPPVPVALTGPDGRAALPAAPEPPEVHLLAPDGRRQAAVVAPAETSTVLALPRPALLTGRVIDPESRRPLAGALVWLSADPGAYTETDAEGVYRLAAIPGSHSITAETAGRLPRSLEVRWSPGDPERGPTLSLERGVSLAGLVAEGSRKIPGAKVRAVLRAGGSRSWEIDRELTTESGADGSFRLDRLVPGGLWEIQIRHPDFLPARRSVSTTQPPSSPLHVHLWRGRAAFGQVVGPTGQPVAGAAVRLVVRTPDPLFASRMPRWSGRLWDQVGGLLTWTAETGPDGRFRLTGLPGGTAELRAGRTGFAAAIRDVSLPASSYSADREPFDFGALVLDKGVRIEGVVADPAGQPIPEAAVYAARELRKSSLGTYAGPSPFVDQPVTFTDGNGRFTLTGLTRGRQVSLWVEAEGYGPAPVEAVNAPTPRPLAIVLERRVRVSGRLADPQGRPVAGARVSLQIERDGTIVPRPVLAVSRADGRFVLEDVLPGRAAVRVDALKFEPVEITGIAVQAQGRDDLAITLNRGAVVEGRVLTQGGRPVEDARVACGPAAALTDAEGEFRLDGVPRGPATLQVLHPSYPRFETDLRVRWRLNTVEAVLSAGQELRGQVESESGQPVAGAVLTLWASGAGTQQAVSGRDGRFRFPAVPEGVHRLQVDAEDYAPAETSVLVPGRGFATVRLKRGA